MNNFEYEIYVPLADNQGKRFPPQVLEAFKKTLVEEFGGLTDLNYKSKGLWKIGGIEYRDEIVIWKVIGRGDAATLNFFIELKEQMRVELEQEDILILKKSVDFI